MSQKHTDLLAQLKDLNEQQLRRLLVEHLTRQKLGLYWEANAIERDQALNANLVFPRLVPEWSQLDAEGAPSRNLIIEGDNFDSLRLLQATHRGKIRVIYIDPPYNTGNKDWVYNDHYVGANDRWRHSQWLEFLYRRLTLARDLLTPDGVILVSINDENRARLELLMDEVFPGRRVGSFVWKTRSGSNDESGARFSVDQEHVLVFANLGFSFLGALKDFSQYKNPDNDPRGPWKTGDLSKSHTYIERRNSVRLVRGEHRNYFHPDFVVCLEHYPGDEPLIRLIETKENTKDAARKAKHVPSYYGKVLFLTKDEKRLRWVNDDGSMGGDIDLDDLSGVREWLRGSRPTQKPEQQNTQRD